MSKVSGSTEGSRFPEFRSRPRRAEIKSAHVVPMDALDGFEQLVAALTIRFMGDCADLDGLLHQSIADIGQFLKLDHLVYLDVDADAGLMMPRCKWAHDGVKQLDVPKGVDVSQRFGWLTKRVMTGERLIVHSKDDLPESAVEERRFCEENGIHSFAFLPALHDGTLVGAFSLDNYDEAWDLDEIAVQRLQYVAAIIASAVLRNTALNKADDSRRFQNELSRISTAFVNLPAEDVERKIEGALNIVGTMLDADVVVLGLAVDGDDFKMEYQWSTDAVGVLPFKEMEIRKEHPWVASQLYQNKVVSTQHYEDWPEEAASGRAVAELLRLPSFAAVPFQLRGETAGMIAVNSLENRAWTSESIQKLRLVGEVFGEALERRDAELKLKESYDEIRLLKDKLEEENVYLRKEAGLTRSQGRIIGDSAALHSMMARAEQVAATKSTVLITGETGTGKELLANWVHASSPRGDKLMVKVNCAALPSSLVEAELFGREKGAFTGAMTREAGRFEMADGATLFLDEVGELPLELQAKLLRVLQDGEFERLGSSKTRKVDVRVLVATNRNLKAAVSKKEFREDLFYRLNVFPIEVPPLRERISDVPQLVWSFVQEFSESMGKTIEKIPRETLEALMAYSWPGNVRELRNVIERAMIVSRGPTLRIERLEDAPPVSVGAPTKLADLEREHIETIVESTGWRISGNGGAAEILGLKPTTLEARMKKLGIVRPQRH